MTETTVELETLRAALSKVHTFDIAGMPYAALPAGFELRELEKLLPEPRRIERRVAAHKVEGFVAYVNRFKDERTALYCGPEDRPSLLARLDDHQPGKPSRVTHTAEFSCPRTVEWLAWTGNDKKQMSQLDFANFIEANVRDIIEPVGAEVLRLVLEFQDKGTSEFKSAVRLESGRVQFTFLEKEQGTIQFPAELKVAMPVFQGQTVRYAARAKLRYRISKEGGLTLWYELDRADLVLKQAYADLLEEVTKAIGIPVHLAQ